MAPSKIAVIGLGSMGLGMAKSLLRAGLPVSGFDPDAAAAARLREAGGQVATQAGDAAVEADIAVIAVVSGAQTEEVLFGAGDVATRMKRGGVVVSCATLSPKLAIELGARVEAAGLHYLDAPMSGGAAKAAEGALTFMASGSPQAFSLAQPALDAIAGKVYQLGDRPGAGSSFKMINQLLAGVHIAAACEAVTLGKRLGLDIDKLYEVITASAGNSWMFENRVPHILAGDYSPKSAVNIFVKDLGIVADVARERTFPAPLAATALQMFVMTAAAGMGRDDDSSVARMIAKITGLDLPGETKA